jgi:hypothetical protein
VGWSYPEVKEGLLLVKNKYKVIKGEKLIEVGGSDPEVTKGLLLQEIKKSSIN